MENNTQFTAVYSTEGSTFPTETQSMYSTYHTQLTENTTDNGIEELEYNEDKYWTYIYHIVPVIAIPGIIGNILVIILMSGKRFKKVSTGVFLLVLALTDIMSILLNIFQYLDTRIGSNLISYKYVHLVHLFLQMLLPCCSTWILAYVTLERLLTLALSVSKIRKVSTRQNAWFASVSIYVIAVYVFVIAYTTLFGDRLFRPSVEIFQTVTLVTLFTSTLLPGGVILFCSILLVYFLVVKKINITHKKRFLVIKLLFMNIVVFFLLTVPLRLYNLLGMYGIIIFDQTEIIIFICLATMIHSLNPILYAFSGSVYRKALKEMLSCGKGSGLQTSISADFLSRTSVMRNTVQIKKITSLSTKNESLSVLKNIQNSKL